MRMRLKHIAIIASLTTLSIAPQQNAAATSMEIHNPYCKITTLKKPQVMGKVRALKSTDGTPVIHVDERILPRRELSMFLIAHECCHHTLGHVASFTTGNGNVSSNQQHLQKMELDADCCAARLLSEKNDRPALENAKQFMMRFGPKPTGFGYPSGIQRGMVIRHCSNTISNAPAKLYLNEKDETERREPQGVVTRILNIDQISRP